ncbi:MAG TPA: hypothetical protein VLM89_09795 [Phycisphaerae bacterium]|nr:hypothetical protein [Phycisphaerae bacterium]
MGKRPRTIKKTAEPGKPRRPPRRSTRKTAPAQPPPPPAPPEPPEPIRESPPPPPERWILTRPTADDRRNAWTARWHVLLPHPAAVLLGLGAGWQWAGIRTLLCAELDPSPGTVTMLAAIVLFMTAAGPRLPARFAIILAQRIRHRMLPNTGTPEQGGTLWLLRALRERDESILWLSLAVLASLAGLTTLLTFAMTTPIAQLHRYLLAGFFWTQFTASLLEWLLVALAISPLWLMNGLLAAALAPVVGIRAGPGHGRPAIAAGALLGLGAALCLQDLMADRGLSASQTLLLGALPMFALSVMSALQSHRAESQPAITSSLQAEAPELTSQSEGWIWLALAAWGIGSTLSAAGWLTCRTGTASSLTGGGDFGLSGYAIMLGLGVLAARMFVRADNPSASGCGTALWAAGVAAGVVAVTGALAPTGSFAALVELLLLGLVFGGVLHYLERAWHARAGSETLGFAQMTTALLAGAAIGLILNRWWVEPVLGSIGAITTGALALMAFGGLIQIHERQAPSPTRGRRLGLVFASLAAAIVLFPMSAEHWSRRARAEQLALHQKVHGLGEIGPIHRQARVCIAGLPPGTALPELNSLETPVDWIIWTTSGARVRATGSPTHPIRLLSTHAFRIRHPGTERYDLIYEKGCPASSADRRAIYSIEWLKILSARMAAGGRLVLDVPLAGHSTASLAVVACTFEDATGSEVLWRVVQAGPEPALRLLAGPDAIQPAGMSASDRWSPLTSLLDAGAPPTPAHSIRRDRLTPALRDADRDPRGLLAWLASRSAPFRAP